MSADTLLYLCIYICVCIVAFDLFFAFYLWRSNRILPKRMQRIRLLMERIAGSDRDGAETRAGAEKGGGRRGRLRKKRRVRPADEDRGRAKKQLHDKLMQESYMLAFVRVIGDMKKQAPEQFRAFTLAYAEELARLTTDYAKKPAEYRALMAHVVCMAELGTVVNDPRLYRRICSTISEAIMPDVSNESTYVRQNTFRALASLGDHRSMLTAITIIDADPGLQNEKLMTDDLLLFTGDADELVRELWLCFAQLTPPMQVMALNYFRLLPLRVDQRHMYEGIRRILTDRERDPEVRIAAIRYFRRRVYQDAAPDLIRLLTVKETDAYEYPAIAAASLQSYAGAESERALLDRLSDSNWFTRFNCAESLIALGVDYESIILNSRDRYAKDMLIYRREVYELKKRRPA